MNINGIQSVHGAQALRGPHSAARAAATTSPSAPVTDQLEISASAQSALEKSESTGIRSDLVASLKQQIASGSYETPEKLDAALSRLLDQIG
jgi:negative regulator of flagellin synthesis FlgM